MNKTVCETAQHMLRTTRSPDAADVQNFFHSIMKIAGAQTIEWNVRRQLTLELALSCRSLAGEHPHLTIVFTQEFLRQQGLGTAGMPTVILTEIEKN